MSGVYRYGKALEKLGCKACKLPTSAVDLNRFKLGRRHHAQLHMIASGTMYVAELNTKVVWVLDHVYHVHCHKLRSPLGCRSITLYY